MPQYRYWAGAPGGPVVITIFNKNSEDWSKYAPPWKQQTLEAPRGLLQNGIILYSVFHLNKTAQNSPANLNFTQAQAGKEHIVQYCYPVGVDELTRSRLPAWPYVGSVQSVGTLTGTGLDGAPGSSGGLSDIATQISKLDFRPPLLVTLGDATELNTQVLAGPLFEPAVSPGEAALQVQEAAEAEQAQEAELAQEGASASYTEADAATDVNSIFEEMVSSAVDRFEADAESLLEDLVAE